MKLSDLLTLPTHSIHLPVADVDIEIRPFVVREQRILLQAQQEGKEKAITDSVIKMIDNCTFNKLHVEKLSTTDIEFILIKLRTYSVGSEIDLKLACKSCDHKNDIHANLDLIEVKKAEAVSNPIQLMDNLWVQMRTPTVSDALAAQNSKDQFEVIAKCIESIISGENVFETKDQSAKEVREFVDNLQDYQQKKIKQFFDSIPSLHLPITFKCTKCGENNEHKVEGLIDFFT